MVVPPPSETEAHLVTMSLYDTPEGVDQYVEMADGYDGRDLIERLRMLVPAGARVLELGIGPGKDLDMLAETFDVVGSDLSEEFLERFAARRPEIALLQLDAARPETDERFDAIYSNKVLQHLTREELADSLEYQAALLLPDGVLLHSLWVGDHIEEMDGLIATHWTADSFAAVVPHELELVDASRYEEMEPEDSLCVVLVRRADRT